MNIRKVVIAGCGLLLACSLALLLFTWGSRYGREKEMRLWQPRQESWQVQLNQVTQERDDLLRQAAESTAENPVESGDLRLLEDLHSQIELIPIQPQLGGTMRFFPDLTKILNEKYVYAYAEDGHVAADMIFRYQVNEDESIQWMLVMWDTGNGWEQPA